MLSVLSGVIVAGAGVGGFWYIKPRNGQVHWLATKPVLDWLIPILIVSALAIGLSMVVAGVMS